MKADVGTRVPKDTYEADLEVLKSYQAYSAEIIRLSLLGIAGLAFFLVQLVPNTSISDGVADQLTGILLGFSAALFLLATGCALSHRYHSSDGFACHIKAIRLASLGESALERAVKEGRHRNRIYKLSNRWLVAAASLFGAGGLFFVLGYGRLLWLWAGG